MIGFLGRICSRCILRYVLVLDLSDYNEEMKQGLEEGTETVEPSPMSQGGSFFDYIMAAGLEFDTRIVEDFLLSLKAKQFLILSGGTGTGKTKLAKIYGEFISNYKTHYVEFPITIGKGPKNRGFTLSSSLFFKNLPPSANAASGIYQFLIGDVEGQARVDLAPRVWMYAKDPNRKQIMEEFERQQEINNKSKIFLKMPVGTDVSFKNYLIVPVGSNWTDNRHIIGYRNAITDTYSHTPALDFIFRSNKSFACPHLLILDEMNLSHVERYFSDVISCMESHEPIILDVSDKDNILKELELGENLFVAGTVNMDETTYMFSPKVLDRANVIEFEPVSVSDYFASGTVNSKPSGDVEFLQDCMKGLDCRTRNSKQITDEIAAVSGNKTIVSEMVSDLDKIQKIMASMKLSFGFRALDEIMRFMYVAWIYEGRGEFTNWKRYLDSQIRQKIIPKIHGNSSISVPLKEFASFCGERGYQRSSSKLDKMVSVLEAQRYVSFNC